MRPLHRARVATRHLAALLLLAGLSGCGGDSGTSLGSDANSLRVADAAIASGSPQVALHVTDTMLRADPRNAQALLRQGQAYMMTGDTAAASTSLRHALALDPKLDVARLNLGRIALATDPARAESLFSDVLSRDDSNIAALNDLGVARDLQGHHAAAQTAYRQVLAINPDQASARENLGLSLALSGSPGEAVKLLGTAATSSDPQANRRSRDNLAVALALSGQTDQASQLLREEMSPADADRALAGIKALAR